MHRSLKEAVINPAASTLAAQQRRFDGFVEEFNWQRSHEALGRRTPGSVHEVSPRLYPAKLPEVAYDLGIIVRLVRRTGEFKSLGKELAGSGILVNCVTPAAVETRIFAQMSQSHIDFMLSKIPLARFGLPQEIAALVAWLCSEDCSFSTGAVFDLSGGRATY